MKVCDYNLRILSVDASHPGSAHDAAIWETSQDRRIMTDLTDNGEESWLICKFDSHAFLKILNIMFLVRR